MKKVDSKNLPMKDVDLKELAKKTEGYVGADIEAICREAGMLTLRDNIEAKEVTGEYFEKALKVVRPSGSKEVQKIYADLQDKFKKQAAAEIKEKNYMSYVG